MFRHPTRRYDLPLHLKNINKEKQLAIHRMTFKHVTLSPSLHCINKHHTAVQLTQEIIKNNKLNPP